eukprot:TRINITY_DN2698_c0_g1_i1.p1 TRINITY_DN2698_c0_g1~~TRINITY_DN2698_c0_g1_i1.p1  ORF type:complete len:190 (-),score=29.94 TRINITY_DN2698_c0_g1_i1:175-744(-)
MRFSIVVPLVRKRLGNNTKLDVSRYGHGVLLPSNSKKTEMFQEYKMSRDRVKEVKSSYDTIPCPVASKLKVPISIYLVEPHSSDANQRATYFAIKIETGFAPGDVPGDVIVMRDDFKPFTKENAEDMWDFMSRLLDLYGDGPVDPKVHITPKIWKHLQAENRRIQKGYQQWMNSPEIQKLYNEKWKKTG